MPARTGLLRSDRNLVESMFSKGVTKVLCCTATLAWGVNLPAHAVVIRGTQLYDAQKGAFIDLGILDVMQVRSVFHMSDRLMLIVSPAPSLYFDVRIMLS